MMWYGVGLFHTFEYLGERVSKVGQRSRVKANHSGLSRPVKGTEADAGGNAVDDGLCDLYARFGVLSGDGEREVDDVGLYFFDSHDVGPFLHVRLCARFECRG